MPVTLLLVLKLFHFSTNFFIIFSNVLLWIFLSLTKERENGIFVVIEKVKCAKYSFNLTYNQESAKTLSLKYIHFPFVVVLCVCLFVCLFVCFFAILKDHAPMPSLFFQLEETSLGIHLFFKTCLPISYHVSIWLNE